jgi:sn-glycerol 3-phosphate transport system substrate-binding protein
VAGIHQSTITHNFLEEFFTMLNRKWFVAVVASVLALIAIVPVFAQTPIEIKTWIAFTDYRLDWAKEKAAEFNALYPEYNVIVEGYANYEEAYNATLLAVEQGTLPAITHLNEVSTEKARNSKIGDTPVFKSIEDAIAGRADIKGVALDVTDFIAPVAGYYTLNGKFTSMPWNASSSVMFVNKTQLDAAGVEAIPTTWAEVRTACEAIKAYSEANSAGAEINVETTDIASVPSFCFTFPNHGWFFEQWMAQHNALYATPDNGRGAETATTLALNSEAALSIFTWLKGMHTDGFLYYSGARDGDSWGTVDQAFLTGQATMAVYSSSDTAYYTNTGKDNGFEVVATRLPYNQEVGWSGNIIGGASLWLTNGLATDVEDGALAWLFWLNNTANAADWHKVTGYMPISNSAVATLEAEGWFVENPNFLVAAQQIADSTITPATSGAIIGDFPAIRSVVTAAIDELLLTPDADAAALLEQAQADAQVILDDYNALQ